MIHHVMSEEDFEILPTPAEPTPSADKHLGSHLPNPLLMNLNMPKAGAQKFPSDHSNIISPITDKKVPSTTKPADAGSREKRDRINNVAQKEEAMALSGVTRRKTYEVIARLLGAKKWAEVIDKGGNVRWEWVEDLEKQRQGAEMALRVMGDMIEHKSVEYGIADSTLEKLKALSVVELRSRAASLLEGRGKAVDVVNAEVVR